MLTMFLWSILQIGASCIFSSAPTVFLDYEKNDTVSVYEDSNLTTKICDVFNVDEDIIMFSIIERTRNSYRVIAFNGNNEAIISSGWIQRRDSALGVTSSAYDENNHKCILYKKPRYGRIVLIEEEWNPNIHRVLDVRIKGKWLKVRIEIAGIVYEGWMPPESQCSNPYSTCS